MLTDIDALWVQIVRNKYNVCGIMPSCIVRSNCPFIWRSLSRVWPEVVSNVYWAIGDGCTTNFWNDNLIYELGPLRDH